MTAGDAAVRPPEPVALGLLATAAGGAVGAVARWGLTEAFPVATGHFPWTVLLVNVVGSGLLAILPRYDAVRSRRWAGLFLGPGVLGGFTTMSAASTETFVLLDRGDVSLALAYCLGTLLAALAAVAAADRLTTPEQRVAFEDREGDE
jgi:CrcB protein